MTHCKYHPLSAGTQFCSQCDAAYCDDCSDESALRRNSRENYRCFVCSQYLDEIPSDSSVPPFWRHLGRVYQYPIGLSAIAAILCMSFLSALLSGFGLFQLVPAIGITLYGFACLRETAHGKLSAPEFSECFEGSVGPVFSMLFLVIVATVMTIFAAYVFGIGVSWLFMFFFVVTLPAAIIVLILEEKLLSALDPIRLISVVKAIGTSYFVMLLFLIIMMSSVGFLASLFDQSSPTFFGVLIQSVISNYYFVVEFHILGYIVFQNQHKLGFGASKVERDIKFRTDEKWLNAKIETLVKAGNYDLAIESSKKQIRDGNAQMWQWARCFKLMTTGTNFRELSEFAPKYFQKLGAMQQEDTAADAYVLVKKRIAEFKIADPSQCLKVAESLFNIGRYGYVVEMLSDFHTRSQDLEQIKQSLRLLSGSYKNIPGKEKKAKFYQSVYELKNQPA